MCKQVDEERGVAATDRLAHIKHCEARYGRSIWQQIVDGGDPVPEGAIENAKAQSERELAGAVIEFRRDRMADWQTFAALGRQDVLKKIALLIDEEDEERGGISNLTVDEVGGVADVVDTLLSLLSRSDDLMVRCGVEGLHQVAMNEAWRKHLGPVVEQMLHILASEHKPYTRDCASALRLLSSDRSCRDAIKQGLFTVKQWWNRPLDPQTDSQVRACVSCALVRVAADARIDKALKRSPIPAGPSKVMLRGGHVEKAETEADDDLEKVSLVDSTPLPDWAERAVYALTQVPSDVGGTKEDVSSLMHLLHGTLGDPVTDNVLSVLLLIMQGHAQTGEEARHDLADAEAWLARTTDGSVARLQAVGAREYERDRVSKQDAKLSAANQEVLSVTCGVQALADVLRVRLDKAVRKKAISGVVRTRGALEHAGYDLANAKRKVRAAEKARDKMDAVPRHKGGWLTWRRVEDPAALEKLCEEVTYMAMKLAGKKSDESLEKDFKKQKKKLQKMVNASWSRVWAVFEEGRAMLWEEVDLTNGVGRGHVEILELTGCRAQYAAEVPLLGVPKPPSSATSDAGSEQWSPGSRPGTVSDLGVGSRPGTALTSSTLDFESDFGELGDMGDTFPGDLDAPLEGGRNPKRLRDAVNAVRAVTTIQGSASRAAAAAAVDSVLEAAEQQAIEEENEERASGTAATAGVMKAAPKLRSKAERDKLTAEENTRTRAENLGEVGKAKLDEYLRLEGSGGGGCLFDVKLTAVMSGGMLTELHELPVQMASDGAPIQEQEEAIKKLNMRIERRNKALESPASSRVGSRVGGSSKAGTRTGQSRASPSSPKSVGSGSTTTTRLSQLSETETGSDLQVDLHEMIREAEGVLATAQRAAQKERTKWVRVFERASTWNPKAMRRLEEAAEIAAIELSEAEAVLADAQEAARFASHAYEMLENGWRGCKQLVYGISTVNKPSGRNALVENGCIETLLEIWQEEDGETGIVEANEGGGRENARGEEQLWALSMLIELVRSSGSRCDEFVWRDGVEILKDAVSGQQQRAAAEAREHLAREEEEADQAAADAEREMAEAEEARQQAEREWADVVVAQEELAAAEDELANASSKDKRMAAAAKVKACEDALAREIAEAEEAAESAEREQREAEEAAADAARERAEAAAARKELDQVEADEDADDEWLMADAERQRADKEIAEAEEAALRAKLEANDVDVARKDLRDAEKWLQSATNEKILVQAQAAVDEARERLAREEAEAAGAIMAAEKEQAEAEEERARVDRHAEEMEQEMEARQAREAEEAMEAEELTAMSVESAALASSALEDARALEAQANDRLKAARLRLAAAEMEERGRQRRKLPLPST